MVTTLKIIPSVGGHYILSHLRLHQEGVFVNKGDIEHECSYKRKERENAISHQLIHTPIRPLAWTETSTFEGATTAKLYLV